MLCKQQKTNGKFMKFIKCTAYDLIKIIQPTDSSIIGLKSTATKVSQPDSP